jgi:hypothetical protein
MRSCACGHCGGLVFFENSVCLRCSTPLRFVPDQLTLVAMDQGRQWFDCANRGLAGCNWVAADAGEKCWSCRLTRTRPRDSDAAGLDAFVVAERAKRRALVQLLELGLPGLRGGPLAFDLLSSAHRPVTTGHADGVITIDLAESDDARREARRAQLSEPYRTMLGHLRHELGHYLQPWLLDDDAWAECRRLFGDERVDYAESLDRHYAEGPPPDWEQRHVSAYAAMHPWEDWAETFAHYLHIRDTLQTAGEYGVVVGGPRAVQSDDSLTTVAPADAGDAGFDAIIESWLPLTYALNAISRSIGRDDLYPFALAPAVVTKLAFVHDRVLLAGEPS